MTNTQGLRWGDDDSDDEELFLKRFQTNSASKKDKEVGNSSTQSNGSPALAKSTTAREVEDWIKKRNEANKKRQDNGNDGMAESEKTTCMGDVETPKKQIDSWEDFADDDDDQYFSTPHENEASYEKSTFSSRQRMTENSSYYDNIETASVASNNTSLPSIYSKKSVQSSFSKSSAQRFVKLSPAHALTNTGTNPSSDGKKNQFSTPKNKTNSSSKSVSSVKKEASFAKPTTSSLAKAVAKKNTPSTTYNNGLMSPLTPGTPYVSKYYKESTPGKITPISSRNKTPVTSTTNIQAATPHSANSSRRYHFVVGASTKPSETKKKQPQKEQHHPKPHKTLPPAGEDTSQHSSKNHSNTPTSAAPIGRKLTYNETSPLAADDISSLGGASSLRLAATRGNNKSSSSIHSSNRRLHNKQASFRSTKSKNMALSTAMDQESIHHKSHKSGKSTLQQAAQQQKQQQIQNTGEYASNYPAEISYNLAKAKFVDENEDDDELSFHSKLSYNSRNTSFTNNSNSQYNYSHHQKQQRYHNQYNESNTEGGAGGHNVGGGGGGGSHYKYNKSPGRGGNNTGRGGRGRGRNYSNGGRGRGRNYNNTGGRGRNNNRYNNKKKSGGVVTRLEIG